MARDPNGLVQEIVRQLGFKKSSLETVGPPYVILKGEEVLTALREAEAAATHLIHDACDRAWEANGERR